MKKTLTFSRAVGVVASALALTPAARAVTPIGEHLSIGGFGTLGGVVSNSDAGQYGRDRQTGGADKTPALDVDSNIAVQVDGKVNSWLSGTVQVLGAKREDQGFKPKFEWAYVMVKPLDGLALRGGRMATPSFLVSDSRNIGYANNWLRPPNEVYALNLFSNFEGGDISYRRSFGPVSFTLTGLAGKTTFRPFGTEATADTLRGANLVVDTDWVTLRAGRVQAKVSVPSGGTFRDPYTFTGFGATVDRDNVFLQAEWVKRRTGQLPAATDATGWYAMAGYRVGSVLPYAILSQATPIADFPFHLSERQRTTAVGARWDAFKSADLKFQIDRVDTSGTRGLSFTSPLAAPAFPGARAFGQPVGKVTVFSLALDFTF